MNSIINESPRKLNRLDLTTMFKLAQVVTDGKETINGLDAFAIEDWASRLMDRQITIDNVRQACKLAGIKVTIHNRSKKKAPLLPMPEAIDHKAYLLGVMARLMADIEDARKLLEAA